MNNDFINIIFLDMKNSIRYSKIKLKLLNINSNSD